MDTVRPSRLRLSCVIPCHNEARNLRDLLPRLCETLTDCCDAWELILVDDGSRDDTAALLKICARQPGVRAIRLSRNFGKEAALTAGLTEAAGDVVVMMDADLQHDPALIPSFIAHWARGADMVYAVRERRDDEAWFKRLGVRLFYGLLNRAGRFEVPAGAGDFRLLDRHVVDALLALPERNRFMKGLYAWVGHTSVAVPYQPDERAHGRSHFPPLRLIQLALDGLTSFTTWPLRAVSAVGVMLALAAFIYGAYLTLVFFVYGHVVSGWTTIVVSLMLFAGLQLLSLGILGEYIGRIFEEVKARPLYVVRDQWGRGLPPAQE
ncbi:glycosyltransferase family 2 protein [Roseateles amylovorans]|uniref:Glycosyltransferase family 2 protein n=1 Tax=Roseateles amylovorans TaxID=2978473 RepID=A0ABY6B917_9BURK|nr:glycosyltransferase family 2 protein [Roseateles amylovorans]UXH80890.1 glycosyltransferase family 2 protein [Roseateles amylovorans]